MLAKLKRVWLKWRENSRQHKIDQALYRAGGGRRDAGADAARDGFPPPPGPVSGG